MYEYVHVCVVYNVYIVPKILCFASQMKRSDACTLRAGLRKSKTVGKQSDYSFTYVYVDAFINSFKIHSFISAALLIIY